MNDPVSPASRPSTVPALPGIAPVLMPADAIPAHRGAMAFMSEVGRDGDWIMPREFRVLNVMGKVVIDLTQVRIGPGSSEIQIRLLMGEVTIIVPHHLRVECDGHGVAGEFKVKRVVTTRALPEAPLVRVSGVAVMGKVEVKVIDPNR